MFYQIKQGVERTYTCVLSRRLLRQVHGLRNRCTFALANGLAFPKQLTVLLSKHEGPISSL